MFAKNKVPQSLIDAVKQVTENKTESQPEMLNEAGWEKVSTPTGTKVYGSSYGDSKKARKDQTKKEIDDLKGPNKDYKYHTGPEASHHHVHTEEKDCVNPYMINRFISMENDYIQLVNVTQKISDKEKVYKIYFNILITFTNIM